MANDLGSYYSSSFVMYRSYRIHPCCGIKIETGSKIIAMFHMILAVVILAALMIGCSVLLVANHALDKVEKDSLEYITLQLGVKIVIMLCGFLILVDITFFFLSRYLWIGIKERSYRKVDIWWKITCCFLILCTTQNLIQLVQSRGAENPWSLIEVAGLIFDLYSLWIIHEYKKQLLNPNDCTVEFDRVL